MKNEHFGIAVAEMMQAGCITFIHDSGGQTEIVNLRELRYQTKEEAIEKIIQVLKD